MDSIGKWDVKFLHFGGIVVLFVWNDLGI